MNILARTKWLYILLVVSIISLCISPLESADLISTIGRGSYNTNGEINFPSGVTVDNNGNVYVCNDTDSMISKFDDEGNFITRWTVQDCFGIEVDNDNNIYVAVRNKHKLIKFDSNGTALLEWGSYCNISSGSGCIDPDDAGPLETGDGQFNQLNDVTVNNNLGLVYVVDTFNNRVQVFDASGNFMFKWGSKGEGDGQFKGPRGPMGIGVDQNSGAVYVADSVAHRIQKFDQNGNYLIKWGGLGSAEGLMRWPRSIDIDSNGYVYEADADMERIQKFDSNGNFLMTIHGLPDVYVPGCSPHDSHIDCAALHNPVDGPLHPRAIAVDHRNDNVFVAAAYAQRVDKFDSSGNFLKTWGWWEKGNGVFNRPTGMAIDNVRDYFYVTDMYNFLIQKFDLDGNFITSWGFSDRVSAIFDGGDGSFSFPINITTDDDGNVYVLRNDAYYAGDPEIKRIQKFDQNGNFLLSWNDPGFYGNIQGIAYNPVNSYIYVSDTAHDRIKCFDANGIYIFQFGATGFADGQFNYPTKIAVDRNNGDIYIMDEGNSRIQKFDKDGIFLIKWGSYGSGDGQFSFGYYPGMYADHNGKVYVTEYGNQRVQMFDSNGNFILKWGGFSNPSGIVVDSDRNVYVADHWRNHVEKFAPVVFNEYTLTVNITGAGNGTVTSSPLGIDCGTDCTETYPDYFVVTLSASADESSSFTGWTGGGCSGTGVCAVSMNTDVNITATFDVCQNLPVRILNAPPPDFSSLQPAYAAAVNGDTIQSRGLVHTENLNIDIDKTVILQSGYDCDFINNNSTTGLSGTMTVTDGKLTIASGTFEIQ